MKSFWTFSLCLFFMLIIKVSGAQNEFLGVAIFVTGEAEVGDHFNPGSNPALQLRDDGTNGDAVAGDGIFSLQRIPTAGNPSGPSVWKVSSAGEFGDSDFGTVNSPRNGFDNSFFRAEAGVPVTFIFDTNVREDGFVPQPLNEPGALLAGILTTDPPPVRDGDTVRMVGDFLSELGGIDNSPSDNVGLMFDDGTNGDPTPNDGIYVKTLTGLPPATYVFKITVNGTFDMHLGALGYTRPVGDSGAFDPESSPPLNFTVAETTDTITATFDSARGQVKIENDNPMVNPGPPFFGTSPAWNTELTDETQLFDDGSNGDLVAGDGIFSRIFTVENPPIPGMPHLLDVRQFVGTDFPATGSFPFLAEIGQNVLVQFNTNTMGDGYSPDKNFAWVDPAARRIPPFVQAIGGFMMDLGGSGNWNADDGTFEMFDNGADPDVQAGDNIFALRRSNPNGIVGKEYKAIGERGSFRFQFGGTDTGYTYEGINPSLIINIPAGTDAIFQVDATTGRVGIGASPPARPPTIDAPALIVNAARDWRDFE